MVALCGRGQLWNPRHQNRPIVSRSAPCTLYTPLVFADIMKNADGNDEKDGFGEKSIMSFHYCPLQQGGSKLEGLTFSRSENVIV